MNALTPPMITATREHTISCGHRVSGHESKCAALHGHNYTIHITLVATSGLDKLGRVLDFSVMKSLFVDWLEENYDHKFLVWEKDPLFKALSTFPGVVAVPYNPTAEEIAQHLLETVFPRLLRGGGHSHLHVKRVLVYETPKCSATAEREFYDQLTANEDKRFGQPHYDHDER